MKKERRATLRLRTNKAFRIKVTIQQMDPRYELCFKETSVSTDTGDLRLFSINPQQPGLPSFSGRWDHNENMVDIDLMRNGRTETKNFKGHHTVPDAQGIYHIDIHVPEGNIFTGSIELGTELGLLLEDSITQSK
jgi:hypothetical protein